MSRQRVYEADVEALERRLRGLLAEGGTEVQISRYETDRERVLDLIGHQMREQREHDAAMERLRAEIESADRLEGDADGWVSDGYEAVHQAHLDSLGHVDAELEPELRQVEAMINAPYRRSGEQQPADLAAIDRQIREVHGGLLADDRVEPRADVHDGEVLALDEAGDQR